MSLFFAHDPCQVPASDSKRTQARLKSSDQYSSLKLCSMRRTSSWWSTAPRVVSMCNVQILKISKSVEKAVETLNVQISNVLRALVSARRNFKRPGSAKKPRVQRPTVINTGHKHGVLESSQLMHRGVRALRCRRLKWLSCRQTILRCADACYLTVRLSVHLQSGVKRWSSHPARINGSLASAAASTSAPGDASIWVCADTICSL